MDDQPKKKGRGGRKKQPDETIRKATIGVRVTDAEYAALRTKSAEMGMSPATWLRTAALDRRLPPPPVPAINREQYAELARLSANLNQLARRANEGRPVTVDDGMLRDLAAEVSRLRLALIGAVP